MNAIVKPQSFPDQHAPGVTIRKLTGERGALYMLGGDRPHTGEQVAALRHVLGDNDGRKHLGLVLNWDLGAPIADDFSAPALQAFEELAARGHRVGLTSQRPSDERILEALAVDCIVTGLNVQYFRELTRAIAWSRFR